MSDKNLHPVMQEALAPFIPFAPSYGDIRANDTDYGDVVVEMYYGDHWAVPAWEEWGSADLAGPFATKANADRAVRNHPYRYD